MEHYEAKEELSSEFYEKYGIQADNDSIDRSLNFVDSSDLRDFVNDTYFPETQIFEDSVKNEFEISNSIDFDSSAENIAGFLEARQAGETDSVSTNFEDSRADRSFEFSSEDIVAISSNYQNSKEELVTAQEGFEQAIEKGVDMQDLKEVAEKFGHEDSLDKAVENIIKEDSNEDALKNLAENSKDEKVLEALSKSDFEEVREAVGSNEKTSEATLEKLSEDKSEMVVEAVAGNKAASFETLEKLGENDNSKISETAKETIEAKADEQLKDLDKEKEAKTVSDAIDIMKDGKFDNDSHSDKQAQHSSDKSGQKA